MCDWLGNKSRRDKRGQAKEGHRWEHQQADKWRWNERKVEGTFSEEGREKWNPLLQPPFMRSSIFTSVDTERLCCFSPLALFSLHFSLSILFIFSLSQVVLLFLFHHLHFLALEVMLVFLVAFSHCFCLQVVPSQHTSACVLVYIYSRLPCEFFCSD